MVNSLNSQHAPSSFSPAYVVGKFKEWFHLRHSRGANYFEVLPSEIILHLCQFLTLDEIYILKRTCKLFRDIIKPAEALIIQEKAKAFGFGFSVIMIEPTHFSRRAEVGNSRTASHNRYNVKSLGGHIDTSKKYLLLLFRCVDYFNKLGLLDSNIRAEKRDFHSRKIYCELTLYRMMRNPVEQIHQLFKIDLREIEFERSYRKLLSFQSLMGKGMPDVHVLAFTHFLNHCVKGVENALKITREQHEQFSEALVYQSYLNCKQGIELLLRLGADPNYDNNTPLPLYALMHSSYSPKTKTGVKLLLQYGAKIEKPSHYIFSYANMITKDPNPKTVLEWSEKYKSKFRKLFRKIAAEQNHGLVSSQQL
jgi:hypothetical protein